MKPHVATPKQRVRQPERNVQDEIWKFIAATVKQGLKRLLENLLEDEIAAKVKT